MNKNVEKQICRTLATIKMAGFSIFLCRKIKKKLKIKYEIPTDEVINEGNYLVYLDKSR